MMNRETTIVPAKRDGLVVVDNSAKRRKTIMVVAAATVVVLFVLAFLLGGGLSKDKVEEAPQKPGVSVIVPGSAPVGRMISASGPIAARRDQPVGVAGQGGKVVRVSVDAGSWVKAGQVLAVIDRSVQAQQAAQLSAAVDAARAQAALAQSNYDRALALKDRGFVSSAEIESKKAARDAAYAQVRLAQAQLGATRAQIGQLNITAPTSGLVLERNVEVGQVVSPGSGALFRIAEGGQMELKAQLSQQDLALVHTGMEASVTPIGSNENVRGSIWMVAPTIDPQTRLGEVRISVPYSRTMRPGGFAEASIAAGQANAPVLPQSAVMSDDQGNYVFIIGKDGKIERRAIKIGTVDENGVVVASGLSGMEQVVVSAGPFLNPGQEVAAKRVAARR